MKDDFIKCGGCCLEFYAFGVPYECPECGSTDLTLNDWLEDDRDED